MNFKRSGEIILTEQTEGGLNFDIEKIVSQINTNFQDEYYRKTMQLLGKYRKIITERRLNPQEKEILGRYINEGSLGLSIQQKATQLYDEEQKRFIKRLCDIGSRINIPKQVYMDTDTLGVFIHDKHQGNIKHLDSKQINRVYDSLCAVIQIMSRRMVLKAKRSTKEQLVQDIYKNITDYHNLGDHRLSQNLEVRFRIPNENLDTNWLHKNIEYSLTQQGRNFIIDIIGKLTNSNESEHFQTVEWMFMYYIKGTVRNRDQLIKILHSYGIQPTENDLATIGSLYQRYQSKPINKPIELHAVNKFTERMIQNASNTNIDNIAQYIFDNSNYGKEILYYADFENAVDQEVSGVQNIRYSLEYGFHDYRVTLEQNGYETQQIEEILYHITQKSILRLVRLVTSDQNNQQKNLGYLKELLGAYNQLHHNPKQVFNYYEIESQAYEFLISRIHIYYQDISRQLTQIGNNTHQQSLGFYKKHFCACSNYQKTLTYIIKSSHPELVADNELDNLLQKEKWCILQHTTKIRWKGHKIAILRELYTHYNSWFNLDGHERIKEQIKIIINKYRTQLENNWNEIHRGSDNINEMCQILYQELWSSMLQQSLDFSPDIFDTLKLT